MCMQQLLIFGGSETPEIPLELRLDQITITEIGLDLLGTVLKKQKNSENYRGLCPFHEEGSPSFYIKPEKKMFFCYGCHEYGGPLALPFKLDVEMRAMARNTFMAQILAQKQVQDITYIDSLADLDPFTYLAHKVKMDYWRPEEKNLLKKKLIEESQRLLHFGQGYNFLQEYFD